MVKIKMILSKITGMYMLAAWGAMMMLAGCTTGLRFYSNEPRPQKEVALVLTNLNLDSITREGQQKMNLAGAEGSMSELLPGKYMLELRYVRMGTYSSSYGATVVYSLQAAAGHVYYIYPEFSRHGTWSPIVVDIVSEEDYRKITYRDPEAIKKWVSKYFAGPRTSAQKEQHTTGEGVITIWR